MKNIISIQSISLVVACTRPLPVFQIAPVGFSDHFPGIFSISLIRENLYSVEVSAISILSISETLARLANSQPGAAPSVHPKELPSHAI